LLGVILNQRGVADGAEKELREAARLDPRSEPALTNLGVLLARTSRADEAITILQRAIALAPEHSQAAYNLAVLYVGRKDYDRAIPLLERTKTNEGGDETVDIAVLITLVDAYAHANRQSDALKT